MEIYQEGIYFNDTVWGNFIPTPLKEDVLLLLKTISSYNFKKIKKHEVQMLRIGYKITKPLKRKLFKYTIQFGRIVPVFQRALAYKEITDGKFKKTILICDRILYSDESLELMKQFHEPSTGSYLDLDQMIKNKKLEEEKLNKDERKES